MRDRLYAQPLTNISDFVFDESVADVFTDMVQRSVPGYATVIQLIKVLAAQYVQQNSQCYDLGCSLGAVTMALCQGIVQPGCRIIAVDNSAAMVDRLQQHVSAIDDLVTLLEVQCQDINEVNIHNASFVVLNYTLQFIAVENRFSILSDIYNGLLPGGVLILSEKICSPNESQNELLVDLHHAFKKTNGYSDLEISQKRQALEKVLSAETLKQHQTRLKQAGFQCVEQIFQCFNFVTLFAQK